MNRFVSPWFAIVLACGCCVVACGRGAFTQMSGSGTGGHASTSTRASSSGSGAGGAGATATTTDTGGGSGGAGGTGGAAMVTQLFVDALGGDDANPGTEPKPFKTLTHALSIATAGQSVQLYSGTYDATNGETFPEVVPDGVNVAAAVAGEAIVLGDPGNADPIGVELAGNSVLHYLQIQGFAGMALSLTGSANVTCEGCAISNVGSVFHLHDGAQLTMMGGDIGDIGPGCAGPGGIGQVDDASSVTLAGVDVHDVDGPLVMTGTSNATLQGSTLTNVGCLEGEAVMVDGTGGTLVVTATSITAVGDAVGVYGNTDVTIQGATLTSNRRGVAMDANLASVTLTDTTVYARDVGVQVDSGTVTIRGTTLAGAVTGVLFAGGSIDLGTLADPGGNTLQTNTETALQFSPSAAGLVPAVGNTWIPSTQGADANGHYTFGVLSGPYGLAASKPNNFAISAGSKVVH